jgi:hypothetical protein
LIPRKPSLDACDPVRRSFRISLTYAVLFGFTGVLAGSSAPKKLGPNGVPA